MRFIIIAIIALAMAVPAFAGGSDNSNASTCGATHGAFADVKRELRLPRRRGRDSRLPRRSGRPGPWRDRLQQLARGLRTLAGTETPGERNSFGVSIIGASVPVEGHAGFRANEEGP